MKSFDETFDDFIWYLSAERRLSENTVDSYRHDLKQWISFLPDLKSAPTSSELIHALSLMRNLGKAKATEARSRAALRHYAKFRSLSDPSWSRVLEEVPASQGEAKFPKALELSEIQAFLNFEPHAASDPEVFRDKALLELLYASGLRVSEAISLRWADIHFDDGWLRVIGKGDSERLVPVSERALKWLLLYQNAVKELWHSSAATVSREVVFLSRRRRPLTRMGVWKIVRRRGLSVQMDELHPHVLRHSFATHLIRGGADVRVVQILLGHRTLSATERYLKISDREVFKLFTEFHPLG